MLEILKAVPTDQTTIIHDSQGREAELREWRVFDCGTVDGELFEGDVERVKVAA